MRVTVETQALASDGAARARLARAMGELSDAMHNSLLASIGAARQINTERGHA